MTVKHAKLDKPRTLEIHEFTGTSRKDVDIAASQFMLRAMEDGRKPTTTAPIVYGCRNHWTAQVRLHLA